MHSMYVCMYVGDEDNAEEEEDDEEEDMMELLGFSGFDTTKVRLPYPIVYPTLPYPTLPYSIPYSAAVTMLTVLVYCLRFDVRM